MVCEVEILIHTRLLEKSWFHHLLTSRMFLGQTLQDAFKKADSTYTMCFRAQAKI